MTALEQHIQTYFGINKSEELNSIAKLFKHQQLKKNQFILQSGESCNFLSFIKSGLIRIYVLTEDGKEVTQWISTEAYFITDLSSLLFNTPARWNMHACSIVPVY